VVSDDQLAVESCTRSCNQPYGFPDSCVTINLASELNAIWYAACWTDPRKASGFENATYAAGHAKAARHSTPPSILTIRSRSYLYTFSTVTRQIWFF
jgi:hypothetical protein